MVSEMRGSPILGGCSPLMSLEEREVIEEASRRVGKLPAQFVKEAGLALAVSILDGNLSTPGNGSGLAGGDSGIGVSHETNNPHRHAGQGALPASHRGRHLGRQRPANLGP